MHEKLLKIKCRDHIYVWPRDLTIFSSINQIVFYFQKLDVGYEFFLYWQDPVRGAAQPPRMGEEGWGRRKWRGSCVSICMCLDVRVCAHVCACGGFWRPHPLKQTQCCQTVLARRDARKPAALVSRPPRPSPASPSSWWFTRRDYPCREVLESWRRRPHGKDIVSSEGGGEGALEGKLKKQRDERGAGNNVS